MQASKSCKFNANQYNDVNAKTCNVNQDHDAGK